MEITLEKIELVKDRTGVTYKEAKEALEAADGNVVDAIVAIEQSIDQGADAKLSSRKDALINKMKEVFKKGNVARIRVTRNGEVLINIPLNLGVLGGVVAPWGVIAATVAAFGFKCKIEFVKDDGSVINITEKAGVFYEDAKEKSTDIYEDIKDKAPDVYEDIREKGEEALTKAKYAAKDVKDILTKEKGLEDFDIDFDDIEGMEDLDYDALKDTEWEEEKQNNDADEKCEETSEDKEEKIVE